jgi:hypothetical protein
VKPIQQAGVIEACIIEANQKQFTFTTTKKRDINEWIDIINSTKIEFFKGRASLRLDENDLSSSSLSLYSPAVNKKTTDSLSRVPSTNLTVQGFNQPASPRSINLNTKLSKLISIFDEAFQFQQKLFQLPIDLETLMPQFTQQLPPSRMIELYNRMQSLKHSLEELLHYNDQIDKLFNKEKTIVNLSKIVHEGQTSIGNMRDWIASTHPKSSNDPSSVRVRTLMAYIMQWYLELVGYWDDLEEAEL